MKYAGTNFNLLVILVTDLVRHKVQILLFILVVGSAMAVTLSTHHNRQQIIALEQLMREQDKLDVEWRNLVLEQRALTEHNRIETLVERELQMYRPSVSEEIVVRVK